MHLKRHEGDYPLRQVEGSQRAILERSRCIDDNVIELLADSFENGTDVIGGD
ncbi:hypothetical protein [Chloroflexus aurantiacus]|uniref:hypothetical protein n=1 Tax=Chloroflexus aurantiacus TaxID=1108 RepID=UPI0000459118|nr:hypothetical protein [Chloroflexus aurantiacus]